MAKINIRVAGSSNEYGVTISYQTRQIEVPDGYRFANNTILSQTEFTQLESVPFQHRGLAIVGRDSIQTQGGMDNAWKDYKGHLQSRGVSEKDQAAAAFGEWNARISARVRGVELPKTPPRHQAETEAAQMKMAGFGGIFGAGVSVVGFGVAGLAIRGLATGVGALVGRMGASAAASAATKKGVEYAVGAIFGGQYIAEAWKTGGKDFKDSLQGKASDKAGALSTLTGGLWGLTGLPDIPLPAALAKGANTASGILAPALFLGLLPWGRLRKKGGKEGKQEGDFSDLLPWGQGGKESKQEGGFPFTWPRDKKKRGGFLLMPDVFVDNFQRGSEAIRDFMKTVEFKDGKWQPKDRKKRRLFLLPGQKPEWDPDSEVELDPDPLADDPAEWNPDPAIDMAPVPEALAPLPLPQLLPIPAPVQEPAPRPVPGNWNPDPNIEMVPVPPDERDKERAWRRKFFPGVPDENWDGWGNQGIIPRPVPEKPEALAPDPIPAPLPVKPLPPLVPKPDPEEMPVPAPEEKPKPLPPIPKPVPEEIPAPRPGMVPPPEFWNPLPLPGTIPDLEIKPDVIPAPLPGQAPAPDAVPAPGMVPVPAPIMPLPKPELKPDVKPKPGVKPEVKPELQPAKPKRMRAVKAGVKEGSGDFDDDEENFPGISMRYGNWLPAAPSFHTGQYPLPPYIIKSGRIVYNVD